MISIILVVALYSLIGATVMFALMYLARKYSWDTYNTQAITIVVPIFWPVAVPVLCIGLLFVVVYNFMDNRVEDMFK